MFFTLPDRARPEDMSGPEARAPLSLFQLVAEVAVAGALHDRLRAGEVHRVAIAFRQGEVRAADQQETELGRADLLVELGEATAGDVHLEGLRVLPEHLVIERICR